MTNTGEIDFVARALLHYWKGLPSAGFFALVSASLSVVIDLFNLAFLFEVKNSHRSLSSTISLLCK